ncbi:hypothetical protein [Aequorivita marina]|uniref:hypothetical protein n=1 Tax=Aequorivita marina TaxID=3073654 RepID=UPI0028746422|nr:hypothetical protein [Aequorivita sp. S2608]MDS1297771.1 hypothetical protein [Aequorivita sp. S2608]
MRYLVTFLSILCSLNSFSQHKNLKNNPIASDSTLDIQSSAIFLLNEKLQDSLKQVPSYTLKPSILEHVNKLDEVVVLSKSKFNAVTLGIIQKEIKPLTQNERRLYTAGDFKPIHLLSLLGGSLQVDPIINAISGRTKRLKKYIEIEKKERNIIFLEDHFTEYMQNNLNVGEAYIGRFRNYLIENEKLQELIDRKNFGELYFLIGDEWLKFKGFQNDSLPIFKEVEKKQ